MTQSGKSQKNKRGTHPNSLKNLKSGEYGQDHSKSGYSLTSALKDRIAKDKALRDKIVDSSIEGAILREPTPFKEVWERLDGKVPGDIPPGYIDNRQVNIIVSTEKAKMLTENVGRRFSLLAADETEGEDGQSGQVPEG